MNHVLLLQQAAADLNHLLLMENGAGWKAALVSLIVLLMVDLMMKLILMQKQKGMTDACCIPASSSGLYSRSGIMDWLQKQNQEDRITMVMLDLDDTRLINDSLGLHQGDCIIQEAGEKIHGYALQKNGKAARYDGDCFLLVLPDHADADETSEKLQKLLAVFVQEILIPSFSIGISFGTVSSFMNCIQNAEAAMYEAKKRGRGNTVVYDENLGGRMEELSWIRFKLQQALCQHRFTLYYQPKVDAVKGTITGYEALVRIKDSSLSPARFIPVAERYGWICSIGRIVTELAVKQLAEWKKEGIEDRSVSINYSAGQLADRGYVDYLHDLLDEYQVSPSLVSIEITESLYLENAADSLKLLEELKEIGVSLDLDDFGSGYSNLSYLSYLPASTIKLDKSLIDAWPGTDTIGSIIDLGHQLGKKMIAEGVEERWQYEKLKELGCDSIQGYYFARPLPPQDAIHVDLKGKL